MRGKLVDAAKFHESRGSPAVAIEKVGMSVAQLDDFTPAGAALGKLKLTELFSSGGKLGRINIGATEFERATTKDLPGVLRSALSQQTAHAQRTGLPMDRIQSLILQQHSANQCGVFMRFYTKPEDRDMLVSEFLVCEDIEINLDMLSELSPAEAQAVEDLPKRVIMQIEESWKHPEDHSQFQRNIEFFQNEGADAYVHDVFKNILTNMFHFPEVTINSMCDNHERVRIQRDPSSAWGFKWTGVNDQHQTDQPAAEAEDADGADADETDPIETTDGNEMEFSLNEMD